MKKLSETYEELGIAFEFPIEIKNASGKLTYREESDGFWYKYEYDAQGKVTYYEEGKVTYNEEGASYWARYEYNSEGYETYCENSGGLKKGTPNSAKTCEGKVVEVDGIKYELKAL